MRAILLFRSALAMAFVLSLCFAAAVVHAAQLVVAGSTLHRMNGLKSAELTMFVPSNPIDCDSTNPWQAGRWAIAEGGYVPSGGCLGLRFILPHESYVFVLHEDKNGALTRFLPEECKSKHLKISSAGQQWYPQPREGREQIIILDGEAGEERFHLMAINDATVAKTLWHPYAAIPPAAGLCRSELLNLETAVERGKDVQDIDVHSEDEKSVVTCWVMSLFSVSLGASRACADFRESTADSRLKASSSPSLADLKALAGELTEPERASITWHSLLLNHY